MAIAVLLNNFMHDFSAAGWLFGAVVLWSVLRHDLSAEQGSPIVPAILSTLLTLMRLALVGIVVFGVVRAIAYQDYEWSAAAGDSQITLLIVKHVLLTVVFAWGLLQFIRARRFLRGAPNVAKQ